MSDTLNAAKVVLTAARDNVKTGWTQGAFARTASGEATSSASANATCFCMMGAVHRARSTVSYRKRHDSVETVEAVNRALAGAVDGFMDADILHVVSAFNDAPGRTQAEVIAAFDRAIASLETSHV